MTRARRPIATFAAILRRASLFIAALASAVCAASCNQNANPNYAVTGTLTSNSCGAGVMVPSAFTFDAMMWESEAGTTLYWSSAYGTSASPSTLSGIIVNSNASLTLTVVTNVDGTSGVPGPCNLDEGVALDVALGSGSPPSTFTGTLSFSDAVDPGSVTTENPMPCNDQLSQNGGMLDTLPCSYAYSLSGSLQ